jgi:hypothetical protein
MTFLQALLSLRFWVEQNRGQRQAEGPLSGWTDSNSIPMSVQTYV